MSLSPQPLHDDAMRESPIVKFDTSLNAEIARMRSSADVGPPEVENPLSLDEYRDLVTDNIQKPREDQLANFIEAFDVSAIMKHALPGWKIVPLLMPHEHGFPIFDPDRLDQFGNLYYYILDENNLTAYADDFAYMDAVLPSEVIENGIVLPENFRDLGQMMTLQDQFKKSTNRMLRMMCENL